MIVSSQWGQGFGQQCHQASLHCRREGLMSSVCCTCSAVEHGKRKIVQRPGASLTQDSWHMAGNGRSQQAWHLLRWRLVCLCQGLQALEQRRVNVYGGVASQGPRQLAAAQVRAPLRRLDVIALSLNRHSNVR